jgi:hypothetical protein
MESGALLRGAVATDVTRGIRAAVAP